MERIKKNRQGEKEEWLEKRQKERNKICVARIDAMQRLQWIRKERLWSLTFLARTNGRKHRGASPGFLSRGRYV